MSGSSRIWDPRTVAATLSGRRKLLRLLVVSPRFFPDFFGPVVRFRRYASGLAVRGVRVEVFTAGSASDPETSVQSDGLIVHRAPAGSDGIRSSRLELGRALLAHCAEPATRPDVLLLLDFRALSRALRRLHRMGVPMLYVHTMERRPRGGALMRWLKDALWRAPLRYVDAIVVSSRKMERSIRDNGVRTPAHVIPNGVDLDRFRPARDAEDRTLMRRALGLPTDAELVLFVGHMNRRKAFDVLAAAWPIIAAARRRAHLVIVKPTEVPKDAAFAEAGLETIRGATRDAAQRLTVTGPVDNVEEFMRASDVMVFPSRREGMPNVVPEAFAAGLPVVLTPFLGLPTEFGRPGEHYVLVEREPEALAEATVNVLRSPDLAARLGAASRTWVEEQLALNVSLDRYAELLGELSSCGERNR